MNRITSRSAVTATGALLLTAWTAMGIAAPAAHAQDQGAAGAQTPERALPPITLDLRDAPVRQALEQLFNSAKVDYSIDNAVQGFVTLKITDQPFENALRLILRSSSVPLTYTKESGVYIVKVRTIDTTGLGSAPPPAPVVDTAPTAASYEVIQLTYADPQDLAQILGITFIHNYSRQGSSSGSGGGFGGGGFGGMSGGMSGFGGGGMSGMGGMGGGMMGGMGGMSGGMSGFGGGMMGGGRGF